MQVQVRNGGSGIFTCVDVYAVTGIIHAFDLCDLGHHGKQMTEQLGVRVVVEIFVVLFGHDKRVNWSFGLDIVEGVADFVLVDLLRRDLARYDLAKQAIISMMAPFSLILVALL